MACVSCSNSGEGGYFNSSSLLFPPYNSNDILVYDQGEVRFFNSSDWPNDRHKLLLFYPETNTPVCASEMGAVNNWVDKFDELDCDIYSVTTDTIQQVSQWYLSNEHLRNPKYKALSSYLLPMRLGIMNGARAKRASVIITKDGDVIVQEHFMKVGRSISELHRTLYAYTTDSYCGEGWTDPSDGFLA